MAVHGVSRATRDLDLLVMSAECLVPLTWAALEHDGLGVCIRRGDADDPLAGTVRVTAAGDSPIDIVVGRAGWQDAAIDRATVRTIEGVAVPVVTATDLILHTAQALRRRTARRLGRRAASVERRSVDARGRGRSRAPGSAQGLPTGMGAHPRAAVE
jgi:hypothetical protein